MMAGNGEYGNGEGLSALAGGYPGFLIFLLFVLSNAETHKTCQNCQLASLQTCDNAMEAGMSWVCR